MMDIFYKVEGRQFKRLELAKAFASDVAKRDSRPVVIMEKVSGMAYHIVTKIDPEA